MATYLRDKRIISNFFSPLYINPLKDLLDETKENWLKTIYEQKNIRIIEKLKGLNSFVRKTFAITKILQSQAMVQLPDNPEFGEQIAMEFCQFFSENIEDFRLHGDRSIPLKRYFKQEPKLD